MSEVYIFARKKLNSESSFYLGIDVIFLKNISLVFSFALIVSAYLSGNDSNMHSITSKRDNKLANSKTDLNKQLIQAARDGNTKKVKDLIAAGADVNAADAFGYTALMGAANGDTFDKDATIGVVKALIEAGASVNAIDIGGGTALMSAVKGRRLTIVRLLIAAGADVKAVDCCGKTARKLAKEFSYNAIVNAIDDPQEDLNDQLICAAGRGGNTSTVKSLIAAGANPNAMFRSENELCSFDGHVLPGESVLMVAVKFGYFNKAKILIEAGANVNATNKYGDTVLMCAIDHAPLHMNIRRGGDPIKGIKSLIEAGANLNATNKYGKTAITLAKERELVKVLECLYKNCNTIENT